MFFIKIIFYLIELVDFIRSILDKLFSDNRFFLLIRNEVDIIEKQLEKLTFISFVIGVAVLFYSYKFAIRIISVILDRLLISKKVLATERKKEIITDDISKIVHFHNFDKIELEFKEEGQAKLDVLAKFKIM